MKKEFSPHSIFLRSNNVVGINEESYLYDYNIYNNKYTKNKNTKNLKNLIC